MKLSKEFTCSVGGGYLQQQKKSLEWSKWRLLQFHVYGGGAFVLFFFGIQYFNFNRKDNTVK
jgi:hypothetical protein